MPFCSRYFPCRLGKQSLSALIENFRQQMDGISSIISCLTLHWFIEVVGGPSLVRVFGKGLFVLDILKGDLFLYGLETLLDTGGEHHIFGGDL